MTLLWQGGSTEWCEEEGGSLPLTTAVVSFSCSLGDTRSRQSSLYAQPFRCAFIMWTYSSDFHFDKRTVSVTCKPKFLIYVNIIIVISPSSKAHSSLRPTSSWILRVVPGRAHHCKVPVCDSNGRNLHTVSTALSSLVSLWLRICSTCQELGGWSSRQGLDSHLSFLVSADKCLQNTKFPNSLPKK